MGELHISTGWEHSFSFFNASGDIRAIGFDMQPLELETGEPAYSAIGEYYGNMAVFGLAYTSDSDALAALEHEVNANLSTASQTWTVPHGLKELFAQLSSN